MHELSIAQEIISIVQQHVPAGQSQSVKAVRMKIGKMTAILPDSLQFCFDALITGSPMEGAKLEIDSIPLTLRCHECKKESALEGCAFVCPECGSANMQVIAGNELNIIEIELHDQLPEMV
jgi:hydrogenase nickel incorporation protein HypA/HybF